MLPRRFSSTGFVLARKNYGEADRILIIYSKDYGKISFIAKGVRKPKSRKRGSIEIFSHIKFSASRGKTLNLLLETEMTDSYSSLRDDLRKVSIAYYFLEIINRLTHEEEKNVELYSHLEKYFRKLKVSNNLKKLRKQFAVETLVLLGFWPRGKLLDNPDTVMEDVAERKIHSISVGKKVLS